MTARKYFDAHVHMFPKHLLGQKDRLGVTWKKNGEWEFDGGFIVHRMPPYMEDSSFTAEALIANMDHFGIERSAIMQSLMFHSNEDIAAAIAKYPDRLIGAMILDPQDGDMVETIKKYHDKGITIIKLEMKGYTHPLAYPDIKLNSPAMMQVFDEAEKLHMTVTIDPDAALEAGYQVEELKEAIEKHPGLRFVICHFFFAQKDMLENKEKYERWQQMRDLSVYENVWCDVSAMPDLFLEEGYPFKSALKLMEEYVGRYGTKKMIWGSDIPGTFNSATYAEMMKMFEDYEGFTEECKDNLFYHNAVNAYM